MTYTRTSTPTITPTREVFPYIITISALNEAGEIVKLIASERANAMFTSVNLIVPGSDDNTVIGYDKDLGIFVPGVETYATKGSGGTLFNWDITNNQSQYVKPGKYFIKIEESDGFGHINVIIKEITVIRVDEYIELKIYNTAGEVVRVIRAEGKPMPAVADLGSMGEVLFIKSDGTPANIKYGSNSGEYIEWDGKNSEGKAVAPGNYEIKLTVKPATGSETSSVKTVTLLREDKKYLESFEVWPNPVNLDTEVLNSGVKFNWTCSLAGETGTVYVRVYNIAAELVWEKRARLEDKSVSWNMRTRTNEYAARGYYTCIISAKNREGFMETKTVKMAVVGYR